MKIHRTTRTATRTFISALAVTAVLFTACSAEESSNPITDPITDDTAISEPTTDVVTSPAATAAAATGPADSTPATNPPVATAPPTTNPTPTPTPTNPPNPDPPPTDAPVDTDPIEPSPTFNDFTASNVSACAAPDVSIPTVQRTVTLTWDITGADSIYVAIGNVDGPYATDLPAVGSIQLNVNCPDAQTYYLVADNAAGRTVMEATR